MKTLTEKQLAKFEETCEIAMYSAQMKTDKDLLKKGFYVSAENVKMNGTGDETNNYILSISLPAGEINGTCCRCTCKDICYAKKGKQAMYSTQMSYHCNWEYYKRFGVQKTIESIITGVTMQELQLAKEGKRVIAIRAFAAGDIPDIEYMDVLKGVADYYNGKYYCFGFTRKPAYVDVMIEKYGRGNLNMIISNNGTEYKNEYNNVTEKVIETIEDASENDFICPGSCTRCFYGTDKVPYCAVYHSNGCVCHLHH